MELQKSDEKVILRGNTVAGVNAEIIKILIADKTSGIAQNLLDIPCGNGEFLQAVKDFSPSTHLTGADINPPQKSFDGEFIQLNAQNLMSFPIDKKFQAITCISGVMEFDNTLNFFKRLRTQIETEGVLIVTNDNLLTVRDRLLYFLFGRTRQYPAFIGFSQPTWKILTTQNLRRILWEAGFRIEEIRFVPISFKEWLWLPLALPIYFLQQLYLRTAEKSTALSEKLEFNPFISLFSRHYILVCRPEKTVEKINSQTKN